MERGMEKVVMDGVPLYKSGKVREVFDLGDHLLIAASDRISAFDCILPTPIPDKGKVLNQLSAWWFDRMRDVVPNHMVSTDTAEFPDILQPFSDILRGRAMLVRRTEALPVECVVRGYLIGSGWKEYGETGSVSGVPLREGYQMADKLDEPIFTPAHKAESGHDENISLEQVRDRLGEDVAEQLKSISLRLYNQAAEYALERGIIIADTKFEFGMLGGELVLIDEIFTPDSSRFWPVAQYEPGASPLSFDKQYVRDYLNGLDWDKTPPAPPLPDEVVERTREKYLEAFTLMTGKELS